MVFHNKDSFSFAKEKSGCKNQCSLQDFFTSNHNSHNHFPHNGAPCNLKDALTLFAKHVDERFENLNDKFEHSTQNIMLLDKNLDNVHGAVYNILGISLASPHELNCF